MSSYAWRTGGTPAGREVNNNSGPRAKCDQVIYEAIAKACEILVSSRGSNNHNNATNHHHASNSPSSSRFNLQVPEIQAVRSILQTYRLTLHVPIRLDVYYQHDDEGGRRELLERWCLEYQPAPTERFLQAEGIVTQDPIVQLRHVCKRIVLWLRTLYCWTRLLPAQAFSSAAAASNGSKPPIGFSVYVNSQGGSDDVTDLIQNQGFRWQGQPSPVVSPYGELQWKVIYSPAVCLERLLPRLRSVNVVATQSRPIPQPHHRHQSPAPSHPALPQSAPAHMMMRQAGGGHGGRSQTSRGPLIGVGTTPPRTPVATATHQQQQHTYHAPSHMMMMHARSQSQPRQHQQQQQPWVNRTEEEDVIPPPVHPVLRRRHTSVGSDHPAANSHDDADIDDDDTPPQRVMSGLSLALLHINDDTTRKQGPDAQNEQQQDDDPTKYKRHAALHELPPHLTAAAAPTTQQHAQHAPATALNRTSSTTEYGYAYNSHIPWQRIHPSINPPVVGRTNSMDSNGNSSRNLTSSPSTNMLASTPPSGAFLLGTATGMTPPTGVFLLPRSTAPPFQPRPAGFIQEAPRATTFVLPPPADTKTTPASNTNLASLDLLHSSPFQQQAQQQHHPQQHAGSLLSSLSTSGGAFLHASVTNDLRRSFWSSAAPGGSSLLRGGGTDDILLVDDHCLAEEMPFAVDLDGSAVPSSSSLLYASSAVASFAQKCAPLNQNRLKLFGSQYEAEPAQHDSSGSDPMVQNLVDQLAEFHNFGASLQAPAESSGGTNSAADSAASAASSTPIKLWS